jgi:hypothetical protein
MGQAAGCPSVEQLLGITDSADPCQNPSAVTSTGAPAAGTAPCPSAEQIAGIVDPSDPCQATTLANGQPNASVPSTTASNLGSALQSLVSAFTGGTTVNTSGPCFQVAFPWIGTTQAGVCVPAIAVPSPWGTVITVGVVALLVIGLVKKK